MIKEYIWKVESGVNIRKPNTITSSNTYQNITYGNNFHHTYTRKERKFSQTRFV